MAGGYPNPQFLVDLDWLRARLDDPRLRLVDARPAREWAAGHIPGAANVDVYAIRTEDTGPEGVAAWEAAQVAAFRAAGIDDDSIVVAYDEHSLTNAARAVWALDFLDGGLGAWLAAGGPLTAGASDVPVGTFTPRPDRAKLATRHDIMARLDDSDTVIVDTRRITEYFGQERRTLRSGTIPGATYLEWTHGIDETGAIRDADTVRATFAAHGITPDKEIVPFCGGGYRSAHTYLLLRELGYPRVRNYLGSWGEWGNREDTPIVIPERD
jgi:thiosulfate/3-mercaptopyruvate sulfurtransferase